MAWWVMEPSWVRANTTMFTANCRTLVFSTLRYHRSDISLFEWIATSLPFSVIPSR